jgi:hypothetical protein
VCNSTLHGTPFFARFPYLTAPDLHPKMASIRKQKSGNWRIQVRREGRAVSECFIRHEDAKRWAVDTGRQVDRGETPILIMDYFSIDYVSSLSVGAMAK